MSEDLAGTSFENAYTREIGLHEAKKLLFVT